MVVKRRYWYESSDDESNNYKLVNKRVKNVREYFSEEEDQEDPEEDLMTEFELPEEEIEELDEEDNHGYRSLISNTKKNQSNHAVSVKSPDVGYSKGLKGGPKRFWNEDDEITVLKGMIDFKQKNRKYACDDLDNFYDSIKKLLHIMVSKKQLYNKIRILKKKYKKNKEKAVAFAKKTHEQELFMLSEKIWGGAHNNDDQEDKKENKDDGEAANYNGLSTNSAEKQEAGDFWSVYPRLNESLKLEQFSEYTLSDFVKQRMTCIGNSKAKELEEKWMKLQVAETEVKLMRAQLIQEQTKFLLEAIKCNSSN